VSPNLVFYSSNALNSISIETPPQTRWESSQLSFGLSIWILDVLLLSEKKKKGRKRVKKGK